MLAIHCDTQIGDIELVSVVLSKKYHIEANSAFQSNIRVLCASKLAAVFHGKTPPS